LSFCWSTMDCAAEIVSTLQLKPLCVSNVKETRICAEVVMKDGSIVNYNVTLDDWFSMASATLNGLNGETGNALYVPSGIEVLFSLFLQLSRCVACERNGVHYEVFSFESVKSQIAKRFAVLYSGTVFRNETGGSTACFFARVPDKDWPDRLLGSARVERIAETFSALWFGQCKRGCRGASLWLDLSKRVSIFWQYICRSND
jgi:hypothetical protein